MMQKNIHEDSSTNKQSKNIMAKKHMLVLNILIISWKVKY